MDQGSGRTNDPASPVRSTRPADYRPDAVDLAPLTTLRLGGRRAPSWRRRRGGAGPRGVRSGDAPARRRQQRRRRRRGCRRHGRPRPHAGRRGRRPRRRRRPARGTGEPWDDLVARCVADGLVGVECLAGIPGRRARPDPERRRVRQRSPTPSSRSASSIARPAPSPSSRRGPRLRLSDERVQAPRAAGRSLTSRCAWSGAARARSIRYSELARTLGVETGARAPLAEAREAVLELRRGKGMALDPGDHDTWSTAVLQRTRSSTSAELPDGAPAFA